MSIQIERNPNNKYSIINSNTNKKIEEDVSIDVIKKLFISKRLWDFICEVIKIDGDFPNGFVINGRMSVGPLNGAQFVDYAMNQENMEDLLFNRFLEIQKKLNLDFNIIGNETTE